MTQLIKELALAKSEGIIYGDCYNTSYKIFIFTVNGLKKQINLSQDEYDAYDALVEIYKCRREKTIF